MCCCEVPSAVNKGQHTGVSLLAEEAHGLQHAEELLGGSVLLHGGLGGWDLDHAHVAKVVAVVLVPACMQRLFILSSTGRSAL
jgi:hypothetical protein